jgi:glycosyltransferase involved in cell wall biosynthesis
MKKTICLVMIVKDESQVIKRCLDSVKDFIDYWVICDTGSTDGTQEIIKNLMAEYKIPGELHQTTWKDFGTNRTESLELSFGKCDYRFVMDADDYVELIKPNIFDDLIYDYYLIPIIYGNLNFKRIQIFKSNQEWKYLGVLHEYIQGPENLLLSSDSIDGLIIHANSSRDRRDGVSAEEKYYHDALVFEKELLLNKNLTLDLKTRYQFYLAQSYKYSGMIERALIEYKKRVEMGGWGEEVYYSLYQIAEIKNNLNYPESEIIDSYLKAWEYRPLRLEAVYKLIKFLIFKERYFLAFSLVEICLVTDETDDILFLEKEIWDWKILYEYSVLAFDLGKFWLAYDTTNKLIMSEKFDYIPQIEKERILQNFDLMKKNLN